MRSRVKHTSQTTAVYTRNTLEIEQSGEQKVFFLQHFFDPCAVLLSLVSKLKDSENREEKQVFSRMPRLVFLCQR